jgi:hypothetical protein
VCWGVFFWGGPSGGGGGGGAAGGAPLIPGKGGGGGLGGGGRAKLLKRWGEYSGNGCDWEAGAAEGARFCLTYYATRNTLFS